MEQTVEVISNNMFPHINLIYILTEAVQCLERERERELLRLRLLERPRELLESERERDLERLRLREYERRRERERDLRPDERDLLKHHRNKQC